MLAPDHTQETIPEGPNSEDAQRQPGQLAFQLTPRAHVGKLASAPKAQQLPLHLQIKISFPAAPPGARCQTPPQLTRPKRRQRSSAPKQQGKTLLDVLQETLEPRSLPACCPGLCSPPGRCHPRPTQQQSHTSPSPQESRGTKNEVRPEPGGKPQSLGLHQNKGLSELLMAL